MSTGELLNIEPQELQFPFESRKRSSCFLQLLNKTDNYVAFKVKATNRKKYCVRPSTGVVLPSSTCDVIVKMQAQKDAPPDMQCKDKFLLQSVVASAGTTANDVTREMFSKKSGHLVGECKLRVLYVAPPRPPSPAWEGSEEGSSPRVSILDNVVPSRLQCYCEYCASRGSAERLGGIDTQDNSSDVRALITKLTEEKNSAIQKNNKLQQELVRALIRKLTEEKNSAIQQNNKLQQELVRALIRKLTEEKNSAIQQNNKLQQELEHLKREASRSRVGIPLMYVIIIALLGIIVGYFLKMT